MRSVRRASHRRTGLAPDATVLAVCGGDAQVALAIQAVETVTNADHAFYLVLN
jgi:hypothetical protein